jgi:hypothetical protein
MTDIKIEEETEALRAEFAKALHFAISGLPSAQAFQAADHLCVILQAHLSGHRVTFPAQPKYDGEAIAEDWRAGMGVEQITEKHGCTRPTAYKYHPQKKRGRAA